MGDETQLQNLDAQKRAMSPQQIPLLRRHELPRDARPPPARFGERTGTDLFIGRNMFGILAAMKLEEIKLDYVVVDTLRVPRETFAAILEAWRDGYAESIGELTPISSESAVAYFNQMIANIRDPLGYAAWMVPVVSARVP